MTTAPASILCPRCGAQVAAGLLACPACAWLTHGDELTRLAREAEAAESAGDRTAALATWRRTLDLLPAGTVQREKIDERMRALSVSVDGRGAATDGAKTPAKRGGAGGAAAGVGAVGVFLLKAKALLFALLANAKLLVVGLLKVPTLLSALVYVQFWRSGFGAGLNIAVGVVICIYVHEMGHVAALQRYGIQATAPMFIPGFGALVRLKQYPTDAHEDARTGLAGPLWGLFASAAAALLGRLVGWPVATAVGSISATINLFNLLPVWQLDGSRGLHALSRFERLVVAATGIVVGSALQQGMPCVVGLVAGVRAFAHDAHPAGDRGAFWLFVILIVTLGLLATLPVGNALPGYR